MYWMFLIWIAIVLGGFIGWAMNILNLIHNVSSFSDLTFLNVIQIIGIPIAPLGAVLGYVV